MSHCARERYVVTSASNVAEGLAALEATNPDLLILDVMMEEPDDGLLFAHQIRRGGHQLPILMLTSVDQAMGLHTGSCSATPPLSQRVRAKTST